MEAISHEKPVVMLPFKDSFIVSPFFTSIVEPFWSREIVKTFCLGLTEFAKKPVKYRYAVDKIMSIKRIRNTFFVLFTTMIISSGVGFNITSNSVRQTHRGLSNK